jgi:hypothetical protein
LAVIQETTPIRNRGTRVSELFSKRSLTSTTALLCYLALADFIVHMLFAGNYGYFRDELYYIVSGTEHLSLGYVDFPPMVAYIAALVNVLSKDSLISIQVVPALAEALLVFVAGMIARELGGGRKAQLLAAISTLVTFDMLAMGSVFTPDSLDQLWWAILAYLVIRIIRRKEPQLWILAGLVVGLGLLTKLTMFFFVGALIISFLLIPSSRKYLQSKWILVGGVLALAFILPMTYWNFTNGWPMVNFYLEFKGYAGGGGPLNFFTSQLGSLNFFNIPILIFGLYFYLRSKDGVELRAFGLSYILLYIFMTVIDTKPYYLFAVYPMLFAGGALLIEKSSISRKGIYRWFGSRPYVACLVIVAILFAPLLMPILPPASFVSAYGKFTASANRASGSNSAVENGGPLPQYLGDRFGWNTMVSTLVQAYGSLPAGQRSQACIFTGNYGEASAVNFLGKGLGLPEAISGHNSYYVWGPDSCTGQVIITVGIPLVDAQKLYSNVTLLTTINCEYCMNVENNLPIYLCTSPNFSSIQTIWPLVRHYD